MNKEQPIKGWVKETDRLPEKDGVYCIKRIDLLNDVAIYSTDTESFYYPLNPTSLYRKSIDSWLDETPPPIQSGEERLFTLKETLEIWEASGEWEYRRNFGSVPTRALNKDEYFKEKFGILLSSRQNIQK